MVRSAYILGGQPSSSSIVQIPVRAPSRMSSRLRLASSLYFSSCSTTALTSLWAKIAQFSASVLSVAEKWISRYFSPEKLSFTWYRTENFFFVASCAST